MKVKFTWDKDHWSHSDDKAALGWQQGVMVCSIWPDCVGLGTIREPVGTQPRDKIVDDYLLANVEFIGGEFIPKTFTDPGGAVHERLEQQ